MHPIEYFEDGNRFTIYSERREDQDPISMFLIVEIDINGEEH